MQKSTRGLLAAGAAVVLLTGGAGTLAYWNATGEVPGGTIESGQLTLTAQPGGTWSLNGTAIDSPGSVVLVPGDALTYAGGYVIGAEGDNLQATVDVTGAGEGAGGLAPFIDTSLDYTVGGADDVVTIDETNDGDVLAVDLAIDFPFGAVVDNASQQQTVDLGAIAVVLEQTDATP